MEPAARVKKITYQDLTRLEKDRFHDQSGISLVDMANLEAARGTDGELVVAKMPNIPLHKLDSTLLWLAVQRRTPGATWEQALGGNWDWADEPEVTEDPKAGNGN